MMKSVVRVVLVGTTGPAIGQVVTLTHPDIKAPRYPMRDATEQRLHEELHAARMAEIQAAHDVERIQRELRERAPTLPF
mgnify:CR=1 FL=1